MVFDIAVLDEQPAITLGISEVVSSQNDLHFLGGFSTVSDFLDKHPEPTNKENQQITVVLATHLADSSNPLDNLDILCTLGFRVISYLQPAESSLASQIGKRQCCNQAIYKTEPLTSLVSVLPHDRQLPLHSSENRFSDSARHPHSNHLILSPNERRVLELYGAKGLPAKIVARQLGLTRNTVNTYVQRIRRAYAAQGRAAASRMDLFHRFHEDFPDYEDTDVNLG